MGDLRTALIRALGSTARAGVAALAQSPPRGSGQKKRRAKKQGDCSPCAAMAAVDDARQRVRNGTL